MREEKCHNICHTFYLTLITRYTRYRHQPRLLYISTHIYTYLHISTHIYRYLYPPGLWRLLVTVMWWEGWRWIEAGRQNISTSCDHSFSKTSEMMELPAPISWLCPLYPLLLWTKKLPSKKLPLVGPSWPGTYPCLCNMAMSLPFGHRVLCCLLHW